jgi:hypothetical protein
VHKWRILLSLLCAAAASGGPVWVWTDENGQVHYSDRPMPGARQIELGTAQAVPMPAPVQAARPAAEQATPSAQPYRAIEILRPADQETLWNNGGNLEVEVALAPSLRTTHRLDVYLDGRRMNLNATAPSLTVPEVWRGEHSLQAVVLDDRGRELLRSQPVTFIVQQTSIQNPNNPNAPRSSHGPRPSGR